MLLLLLLLLLFFSNHKEDTGAVDCPYKIATYKSTCFAGTINIVNCF